MRRRLAEVNASVRRFPLPSLARQRLGWFGLALLLWQGALPAAEWAMQRLQVFDGLRLPTDVVVHDGRIAVVDGGHHRIVVFDADGDERLRFGRPGKGPGEFDAPVGIGVDPAGRLLVADRGNRRIQIYSPEGAFVRQFAVPERPIDVAASRDGRELYVTANRRHRLLVYRPDGRLLREWGRNGADRGEFRYPATVAVLPKRRLAVVDVFNTRVQIFDADGTFAFQAGRWGVRPGQLFRPKGVAVDARGRLYVSDSYLNVVQVFDAEGAFLYVLRDPRHALVTPAGLAVAGDRLYVAEVMADRVSVFRVPVP